VSPGPVDVTVLTEGVFKIAIKFKGGFVGLYEVGCSLKCVLRAGKLDWS